jgi:hypothetical protein
MIDMLLDDVLLERFDFYKEDLASHIDIGLAYTWWETLIKVCRRWKYESNKVTGASHAIRAFR